MHMRLSKSMQRRLDAIANIKARLERAGFSLRDIDRRFGLARCTASKALQEPNLAGERAIAAALKSHPHLLWRERYHADGRRKEPQPMENYQRPPTRKQRQEAAQADPSQAAA